jgi:single-stranded DNA-binding protein
MSINKFFVGGHVGRDPEQFESNGKNYVGFSFAENQGKDENGNDKVAWHQVVTGGKAAETILVHVKKGDKLVIEGKASAVVYMTKEQKVVPQLKIWLTDFEFASSKSKDNETETAVAE